MSGPKHLWLGDWRARRDREPEPVAPLRALPKPEPEPEPPRKRRWPLFLAAGLGALAVLAIVFMAGALINDGGREGRAAVIGRDRSTDLAVLKLDPAHTPSVSPLALADSDRVQVGDQAIAIGNPFGLDRTTTAGIVSGPGRGVRPPHWSRIDH